MERNYFARERCVVKKSFYKIAALTTAAVMSLTALLIYCIIQGSLSAAYTPEKSSTNTTFSLPIR